MGYMLYRKRPVVIEAVQLDESDPDQWSEVLAWLRGNHCPAYLPAEHDGVVFWIPTLEGDHGARPLDWIIKGIAGEFYPCKPDIFDRTYEIYDEEKP